jgi:hypothetical protein
MVKIEKNREKENHYNASGSAHMRITGYKKNAHAAFNIVDQSKLISKRSVNYAPPAFN